MKAEYGNCDSCSGRGWELSGCDGQVVCRDCYGTGRTGPYAACTHCENGRIPRAGCDACDGCGYIATKDGPEPCSCSGGAGLCGNCHGFGTVLATPR